MSKEKTLEAMVGEIHTCLIGNEYQRGLVHRVDKLESETEKVRFFERNPVILGVSLIGFLGVLIDNIVKLF